MTYESLQNTVCSVITSADLQYTMFLKLHSLCYGFLNKQYLKLSDFEMDRLL